MVVARCGECVVAGGTTRRTPPRARNGVRRRRRSSRHSARIPTRMENETRAWRRFARTSPARTRATIRDSCARRRVFFNREPRRTRRGSRRTRPRSHSRSPTPPRWIWDVDVSFVDGVRARAYDADGAALVEAEARTIDLTGERLGAPRAEPGGDRAREPARRSSPTTYASPSDKISRRTFPASVFVGYFAPFGSAEAAVPRSRRLPRRTRGRPNPTTPSDGAGETSNPVTTSTKRENRRATRA